MLIALNNPLSNHHIPIMRIRLFMCRVLNNGGSLIDRRAKSKLLLYGIKN